MSTEEELSEYASKFEQLQTRFEKGGTLGLFLPAKFESQFKQFVVEVIALLNDELGEDNLYSTNITHTVNSGSGGFLGGPSLACVGDVIGLVYAAQKQIRRNKSKPKKTPFSPTKSPYVDQDRIEQIKNLKSDDLDFQRLVKLCKELNTAHQNESHMSIAMIVLSIIDHVPPIFGKKNFSEVANNYSGAKSFNASMKHLDNSLRNAADGLLHFQIRDKEVLPNFTQVDFRSDLDLLLSEIIRLKQR